MVDSFSLSEYQKAKESFIDKLNGRRDILALIGILEKNLEQGKRLLLIKTQAQSIIHLVARDTQENLKIHLSKLGTMALKAVSPDFPELTAEVTIKRKQVEVEFLFDEKGKKQKPMASAGHGAVDVGDFALRISFWILNKNRAILIPDEPFRNVSPDLQEKVGEMLMSISRELGLQIIMVSHAEKINKVVDKWYEVEKSTGGISQVTLKGEGGVEWETTQSKSEKKRPRLSL